MFKLVSVKLTKECEGESEWKVIIPEDPKRKLNWIAPVAHDKLLVSYLEDVKVIFFVLFFELIKLCIVLYIYTLFSPHCMYTI